MDPAQDTDSDRLALLERLKGAALSSAMTLLSIIQGVALADLAGVVWSNYAHFDLTRWLLVVSTFILLIAAWNQITMDTITWVQVHSVEGSMLPFVVGAFELFLNHAIVLGFETWLFGVAIIAMLSTVGIWIVAREAAQHKENAGLLVYLKPYRKAGQRYNVAGTALLLAMAVANALGAFASVDRALGRSVAAEAVAVLLVAAWMLGFIARHAFYWRKVVAYARALPSPEKVLRT